MNCARSRCSNSKHPSYPHYGGRGIEFRFESIEAGALWVQENLGLHKELQIDRIDNNGHYAAGNLKYSTPRENIMNRSNTKLDESWVYVEKEWPFSEGTVKKYLRQGFSRVEIIEEAEEYVARQRNWWPNVSARLINMRKHERTQQNQNTLTSTTS